MSFIDLTSNQSRVSIDTKQTFEAFCEARNSARQYDGGMCWKEVKGKQYLIKIINRTGGNKSIGPRSDETIRIYNEFHAAKARAKTRLDDLTRAVEEFAGMSRSININRVPSIVSTTLRRLDEFGLLGKNLMVIGTNAMYAYESAAGVMFDAGLLGTTDIDFLWDSRTTLKLAVIDGEVTANGFLAILRKADRSFEMSQSSFRAINKSGFHVDLVRQTPIPPWRKGGPSQMTAATDDLVPADLPNIKWLLSSEKFRSIVIGQDGIPAPMVAPDPRAYATYKLWLCEQPDREIEKKKRDKLQALATIDLVREKFSHLKFDKNAERMFPEEVRISSAIQQIKI